MVKKTYVRCSPFSFLSSQLNDTGVSDTATALADLAALVDVVDLAGVVVVGAQKVPCAQTAVVVSVLQLAEDAVVVAAFHFRARSFQGAKLKSDDSSLPGANSPFDRRSFPAGPLSPFLGTLFPESTSPFSTALFPGGNSLFPRAAYPTFTFPTVNSLPMKPQAILHVPAKKSIPSGAQVCQPGYAILCQST